MRFRLAPLAILSLAGSATAADDVKVYHGSICAGRLGPVMDFYTDMIGAVCTSTTLPCSEVVCGPIIRDRVDDPDTFQEVRVELFNVPGTVQSANKTRCVFWAMGEDANGGVSVDAELQESTTAGGFKEVVFNGIDASSGDEGSYYMTCNLGRMTTLYQIKVTEDTQLGGHD